MRSILRKYIPVIGGLLTSVAIIIVTINLARGSAERLIDMQATQIEQQAEFIEQQTELIELQQQQIEDYRVLVELLEAN